MTHEVVGRIGAMDGEEHITEQVAVRLVDGDVTAIARGPSEEEALAAAQAEIKRFRDEQELLAHPEVVAAREALVAAVRRVREA